MHFQKEAKPDDHLFLTCVLKTEEIIMNATMNRTTATALGKCPQINTPFNNPLQPIFDTRNAEQRPGREFNDLFRRLPADLFSGMDFADEKQDEMAGSFQAAGKNHAAPLTGLVCKPAHLCNASARHEPNDVGRIDGAKTTERAVSGAVTLSAASGTKATPQTEKSRGDTKIFLESSEVNGVNLDSLGAAIDKPGEYPGYAKTDYGYVQSDPIQPGPDYLLLIEDPKKMTEQQKHYMRNIELAELIREGRIPTHLDEFMDCEYDNYRLLPEGESKYHMNGENGGYNVKLVSDESLHGYEEGQLEVVYSTVTGKLDLSAENMPTINRIGPGEKLWHVKENWGHYSKDVKPYGAYKNTPHDSTSWFRRRIPASPDQSDAKKKAVYDNLRKELDE
jgi:hypothetical protein